MSKFDTLVFATPFPKAREALHHFLGGLLAPDLQNATLLSIRSIAVLHNFVHRMPSVVNSIAKL